jgi:hypothetical protein
MSNLTPLQLYGLSAINIAGLALPVLSVLPTTLAWPPFNIVISNIPGTSAPQYCNGARLEAMYPASIRGCCAA